MTAHIARLTLLLAVVLGTSLPASAQSYVGTTGIISAPSALVQQDGTVVLGTSYTPRTYAQYGRGRFDLHTMYAALTFLPFLEVGLRFTRILDAGPQALGDRSVSVRLQVFDEGRYRPALLLGAHDVVTTTGGDDTHFAAFYLAAAKQVPALPLTVHAGYGFRPFDAVFYDYAGFFGGATAQVLPFLDLLGEHDGRTLNVGARLTILGHLQLLAALQEFDALLGGASLQFRL